MIERNKFALIRGITGQDGSDLVELFICKGYQYIVLKNKKFPNYV